MTSQDQDRPDITTAAAIAGDPSIPAYASRKAARLLGAFMAAVGEIAFHKSLTDEATTPEGRRLALSGLNCAVLDAHEAQRVLTLAMPTLVDLLPADAVAVTLGAAECIRQQDAIIDVMTRELRDEHDHTHARALASPTGDPATVHATSARLH